MIEGWEKRLRTFIAIELPDEVRAKLETLQDRLKKDTVIDGWLAGEAGISKVISWARPDTIHLTLKFLGDIEAGRVDAISGELKKAAEGANGFTINIHGFGGFPNLKNPRVMWVGVEESDGLRLLYENIESRMEPLGFEREKRGFSPHLTVGRVKDPRNGKRLGEKFEGLEIDVSASFRVSDIVLFKSELGPGGAAHTPLRRFLLKGNGRKP
ncbi:MAG: RNA 2',3'-cyclic phosphodiesterase [Deltaproteobacteria bacterium]|nr:RNA 2',3'-cyclic phosphodiesterase [Deltaproteobacteria bacterium]